MMEVQSEEEDTIWKRDHIRYWNGYFKNEDSVNYIVKDGEDIPVIHLLDNLHRY